jgi:monothiol glutaredoxin
VKENGKAESVSEFVDEVIDNNDVVLFMKGNKEIPRCGYSEKALVLVSKHTGELKTVDVLDYLDEFRNALEEHSNRETIPQVFVDGEFVGGSDILDQLEERGELEEVLTVE